MNTQDNWVVDVTHAPTNMVLTRLAFDVETGLLSVAVNILHVENGATLNDRIKYAARKFHEMAEKLEMTERR